MNEKPINAKMQCYLRKKKCKKYLEFHKKVKITKIEEKLQENKNKSN
jgi:hypothetical protein